MSNRTKALSITGKVRKSVLERDNYACILCSSTYGLQCAHYIGRAQSGLGIEQNLVMLCFRCHHMCDQSINRKNMLLEIKEHLQNHYPDWDENNLIYRKWNYA